MANFVIVSPMNFQICFWPLQSDLCLAHSFLFFKGGVAVVITMNNL